MKKRTNFVRAGILGDERSFLLIAVLASLSFLLHCGSSGGGGVIETTKPPTFTGSGTTPGPNLVTMADGGTAPGSLIQVDIKIGGPTTSSDLFSFSFDVVLSNPSVIESVETVAGDALTGDTAILISPIENGRVVVGVAKKGGAGNRVASADATIVGLVFKMSPNTPGSTTLKFEQATTQDSQGVDLPINFDGATARIEQLH